jgi:hypothetical protein
MTCRFNMTEDLQGEIDSTLHKLEGVLRHLENVRDNCIILGKKLIESGEIDFGKRLIANGHTHDNSKFFGTEWEHLNDDSTKLRLEISVSHHNSTNPHHPECWGRIDDMPRLYIAEMVCDWKARSTEFGSSLREWVEEGGAKRFGYKKGDKTYRQIMEFVDMVCDKPFKQK